MTVNYLPHRSNANSAKYSNSIEIDRIILPRDTEVVITSFGGVGTTFLLSHIGQYRKTNHRRDNDGFKHSPIPPISFNSNVKYIYIYGDPQLAATSLFRRKFHYSQSIKLQRWGEKEIVPIPKEMTLQEYVSLGVDRFCFSNHFYNWYDKYLVRPTIFLRYETIFDNITTLADFLELPQSFIDSFPASKKRNSQIKDIDSDTLDGLQRMYGKFTQELNCLKDVEIRDKPERKIAAMTYLQNPYRKALKSQIGYKLDRLFSR